METAVACVDLAPAPRRHGPECWRDGRRRSTAGRGCRPGCGACDPGPSCQHHSPAGRAKAPFLSGLAALAVDDRHARARFAAGLLAHRYIECVMDALQGAIPIPQHEVMV